MHRRCILLVLLALLLPTAACALRPAPRATTQVIRTPEPTDEPTAVPAPREVSLAGPACPDAFREQAVASRDAEIEAGGTVTLTLGASPSMPCGWQETSISDESALQQVARHTKWPAEGATPMPGAPGSEIWVLEALEEGTSTVSVECTCLGEEGTGQELRGVFVLSITVR